MGWATWGPFLGCILSLRPLGVTEDLYTSRINNYMTDKGSLFLMPGGRLGHSAPNCRYLNVVPWMWGLASVLSTDGWTWSITWDAPVMPGLQLSQETSHLSHRPWIVTDPHLWITLIPEDISKVMQLKYIRPFMLNANLSIWVSSTVSGYLE